MPAITQDAEVREGAAVAELPGHLVAGWPVGTRVICRREIPHPGAQLRFTDHNGYRFQVFITDQPDEDIAYLEAVHRAHARAEDRIRCSKQTGLANLPFREFAANEVWLELVLMAGDLIAWAQHLLLPAGEARTWEPKRLRYCLLHVAARICRSARRLRLRLQRRWRWAGLLCARSPGCVLSLRSPDGPLWSLDLSVQRDRARRRPLAPVASAEDTSVRLTAGTPLSQPRAPLRTFSRSARRPLHHIQ